MYCWYYKDYIKIEPVSFVVKKTKTKQNFFRVQSKLDQMKCQQFMKAGVISEYEHVHDKIMNLNKTI